MGPGSLAPVTATDDRDPGASRPAGNAARKRAGIGLTAGALGVVFGDIGTSPLYALQAVFSVDGLWCRGCQPIMSSTVRERRWWRYAFPTGRNRATCIARQRSTGARIAARNVAAAGDRVGRLTPPASGRRPAKLTTIRMGGDDEAARAAVGPAALGKFPGKTAASAANGPCQDWNATGRG
jgi:hypothetical protein